MLETTSPDTESETRDGDRAIVMLLFCLGLGPCPGNGLDPGKGQARERTRAAAGHRRQGALTGSYSTGEPLARGRSSSRGATVPGATLQTCARAVPC